MTVGDLCTFVFDQVTAQDDEENRTAVGGVSDSTLPTLPESPLELLVVAASGETVDHGLPAYVFSHSVTISELLQTSRAARRYTAAKYFIYHVPRSSGVSAATGPTGGKTLKPAAGASAGGGRGRPDILAASSGMSRAAVVTTGSSQQWYFDCHTAARATAPRADPPVVNSEEDPAVSRPHTPGQKRKERADDSDASHAEPECGAALPMAQPHVQGPSSGEYVFVILRGAPSELKLNQRFGPHGDPLVLPLVMPDGSFATNRQVLAMIDAKLRRLTAPMPFAGLSSVSESAEPQYRVGWLNLAGERVTGNIPVLDALMYYHQARVSDPLSSTLSLDDAVFDAGRPGTRALVAEFSSNSYEELCQIREYNRQQAARKNARMIATVKLTDCLTQFSLREQLGEEDMWRCPKCKDEVRNND